ncbi:hypothetical protein KIH39_08825 [Telmatocola sphagniphila]|uniref:Uncharacterized protein n=1 Tax=Telmatocola sphagniphila TaxID=1123043 RepID=A0A8E6B9R9_9BACT|nr:hypothetical protein [Telmatocola sphagniphila]QVL33992.1 hypothetical protein KIH39_08825 [Telmatocola sphagniphila]
MVQRRMMFRVGNHAAFDRCLARALAALGLGFVAGKGRQYWKMPELWECPVFSPTPAGSVADQVFECLLAVHRLASGWQVKGVLSPDSACGFSGVFAARYGGASTRVVGLEWASFLLVGDADVAQGTSLPEGGK